LNSEASVNSDAAKLQPSLGLAVEACSEFRETGPSAPWACGWMKKTALAGLDSGSGGQCL